MATRQTRATRLAAAIAAVAIDGVIVAVFLIPTYFPVPVRERNQAPTLMVPVPPLPRPRPPVQNGPTGAPIIGNERVDIPALLPPGPPAPTAITPPPAVPDANVLSAIGRALACSLEALASLPPEQRAACEAKLAKLRSEPAAPYVYTAREAELRQAWATALAAKNASPAAPEANSMLPVTCANGLCWNFPGSNMGGASIDILAKH